MKIVHLSYSDLFGGAARSAYNIHKSLVSVGLNSKMIVVRKESKDKNILEIEIKHDKRNFGKTKYSLMKLTQQAFDLITAYTYKPLQFLLIFSLVILCVIFIFAVLLSFGLINYINVDLSIMFLISILALISLLLIFMSILSEYTLRIHKNSRKLPLYIIREKKLD